MEKGCHRIKAVESTCASALVHPSRAMHCKKQVMHHILRSWGQVDARTAEATCSQAETSNLHISSQGGTLQLVCISGRLGLGFWL